jgi:hypothetical protein
VQLPPLTEHFHRQRHPKKEPLILSLTISEAAPVVATASAVLPFVRGDPDIGVRTGVPGLDREDVVLFSALGTSDHRMGLKSRWDIRRQV